MSTSVRVLIGAIVVGLGLILASCSSPGTPAKANENEALIGANLELSGESAPWGQDSKNGIELALKEVNANPQQRVKLKVIFEDDKSEPAASKNAMKKLITQDGVIAVIGAVGSNRTLAACDVAKEEKVPLMTHASTNVTITEKGGEYVSQICFDDNFQGSVMAKFARNSLKADTAVIMVSKGNAYSEGLADSFRKTFTGLGGKIVDELAYQKGTQDFKTHVTTLKQQNPAVVWLPGYFNEVGLIVKQAREAGFQAPFLGGDGWDDKELFRLAGVAIKGNYVCNHFDPGDPNPVVQDFVKKYEQAYKTKPGAMAALGYDALFAMADAANRASPLTPEGMKNAINSMKGVKGVCGTITMEANRETIKDAVVLETDEKDFKYKETIKP